MAFNPISGYTLQTIKQNGQVASDYYLKFYEANTTTPINMATDASGAIQLAKAKFNDNGMPISNPLDNSTVFVPHLEQAYRLVIYRNETDADNDDTASAYVNIPNLLPLATFTTGISSDVEYMNVAGTDTFNISYTVGTIRVLYNGVFLASSDFTATNGSSIVLAEPVADSGDIITLLTVSYSDIEFTGITGNAINVSYVPGRVRVLYNGIQLSSSDFTAIDGATITFVDDVASTDDIITVIKLA